MKSRYKPLIVSALYDIGRGSWNTFQRDIEDYLHWTSRLLAIDCEKIIYTESKLVPRLQAYNPKKTVIKEQAKETLSSTYLFGERIINVMGSPSFKQKIKYDVPEMTQPWYNLLMLNKLWWMIDAVNHVDATHLIWTDAGCYRENLNHYTQPWPNHWKLSSQPLFFSHHLNFSISDYEQHCLGQWRYIQGGCFIIPKNHLSQIATKYLFLIMKSLDAGYIGSDEKFLDFLYLENSNSIQITKCNWREYFDVLL